MADTLQMMGPEEYLAILKRRRWHIVIPAALLFCVSSIVAYIWPPTYRSSATILIEEPDVPREFVQSTIASYADERVQVITERILTRQNLIKIIKQFDLYRGGRERNPIDLVATNMRQKIGLNFMSGEVVDPQSGRPSRASIAFSITFEHRSAETSRRIVNELVSLYLAENLRSRREKAAETRGFLSSEASRLSKQIAELESQLATFKSKHSGTLPEQLDINMQIMDRTERDITELTRRRQILEERKIYLQSELAQISPYSPVVVNGEGSPDPAERLKVLETNFITLGGIYGPQHPDVIRLSREIEALKKETGVKSDRTELERSLVQVKSDLARAQEQYSDDHPDVVKLTRLRDRIREQLQQADTEPSEEEPDSVTNPAYIQLSTQLEAVDSELKSLAAQRERASRKLKDLEERILQIPDVERQYLTLTRDYENATAKYKEIKAKELQAELGEALESERKSEKFSLIEPPLLPVKPEKPNRLTILLIGFALSIGGGAGIATIAEILDRAVYGPKRLAAITGAMPLVVVPYLETAADKRRTWSAWIIGITFLLALVFGAIYAVNEFVIPLDSLVAKVRGQIGP